MIIIKSFVIYQLDIIFMSIVSRGKNSRQETTNLIDLCQFDAFQEIMFAHLRCITLLFPINIPMHGLSARVNAIKSSERETNLT